VLTQDPRPGFQGSETSWAEVTFYARGNNPTLLKAVAGPVRLDGRRPSDAHPSLLQVTTSKALDGGPGTFSIMLKPSRVTDSLLAALDDDDWVDIVFWRHDRPWHTMRGLVSEIRRRRVVSGSGATAEAFTITGQDWSKIWENTPVWFSPYANNDLVTEAIANQVMQGLPEVVGSPAEAVQIYLKKFLESLAENKGPKWAVPGSMPDAYPGSFLLSVAFSTEHFQNIPARKGFNPSYVQQDTLWNLARQYSDPMFTEFYADLLPDGDPYSSRIGNGDPLPLGDAAQEMTVVLRDKPFPVVDPAVKIKGYQDKWAKLPTFIVPSQQIVEFDIGRSGLERFNTVFVASQIHTEAMGAEALTILAPLIDREDYQVHGMRRHDVQSNQAPDDLDFGVMSEIQRRIIRDWYAVAPYQYNGTLELGIGRPDIRVGCRVKIPNAIWGDVKRAETYYVEQVSNAWSFGRGTRTTLGVTRGWPGEDAELLAALQKASAAYSVPKLVTDSLNYGYEVGTA